MGMSIYNNIPAMNAQNYLRMNQNDLTESLERLSSGLRINRASDDASGLSISEKMRGQIRGLDRSASNAQDGISLIQTAEGALNETTSILQRMRELSVQAANGTYTSNDRQEIQKEIDQLKGEIDRISTSTEFNTKKLLNGDAMARWSASSNDIEAVVRGQVQSGNYKIEVSSKVGKNQVQNSDIMTLKEGAMAGNILTTGNVVSGGSGAPTTYKNTSGITGMVSAESVRTGDLDERTYRIDVAAASSGGDSTAAAGESFSMSSADVVGMMGTYVQEGSNWSLNGSTIDGDDAHIFTAHDVTTGMHGYVEIEFTADRAVDSSGGTATGDVARARFIDVKTGEAGSWADIAIDDDGILDLAVADLSGNDRNGNDAQVFATANLSISTGDVKSGDKMLLSVNAAVDAGDHTLQSTGAGAFKIDERFDDGALSAARELRGAYYVETAASGIQNTDLSDGAQNLTYNLAQLDETTGAVSIGNIVLQTAANSEGTQADDNLNMEIRGTGGLASSFTKLSDIESFTTPDGTSTFNVSQKMTLYGNSRQADIYLEADDTITDLATKMRSAITGDDALGISMGSSETDKHTVDFVSKGSAIDNSHAAVEGTMLVRSLFNGKQGEINVVADQKVLDALNLHELQQSEENVYEVEVKDAHNNRPVGSDTVGDGFMEGVIQGIDVQFKGNIGLTADWNADTAEFTFDAETDASETYLHLVDNSIDLQIGANEGQTVNAGIAQMDVKSLGLENTIVIDQELAERSITQIDKAIGTVSAERSKLGAISNRLDHTINSLSVAEENLQASESRIRDVDIAAEMSRFTSSQMLSDAAMSMLAQANALPQGLMSLLR